MQPHKEDKGSELIYVLILALAASMIVMVFSNRTMEYQTPYDDRVAAELTRH